MKDIPGFEGLYAATTDGRIWSYPKSNPSNLHGKFLKPSLENRKKPYLHCILSKNKKRYGFFVHRLVALAWIPNLENKSEVNHKNGIKTDNRVENLEWCSRLFNIHHAIENGIFDKPFSHTPATRLSKDIVILIRSEYPAHKPLYLSKKYGVSRLSIWKIVTRQTWAHV